MAGIVEGVNAGELPAAANTLPATAPLFNGAADSATAATAKLWAWRSLAAGDGLAYKFVPGVGLYLKNAATGLADAAQAASATGGALGTTGLLAIALHAYDPGGTTYRPVRTANGSGDGLAGASNPITAGYVFNETTWDRARGNTSATLLASAARTANVSTSALTNYNGRCLHLEIAVSAKAAGTTLTPRLLDASGGTVIVAGPAFAAAAGSVSVVQFGPGILTADYGGANASGKSVYLPRSFVVQVVPSDASSVTYAVTGHVLI